MSDIFLSYSSQDREKAAQLTEMLTSAGLSVWIDQAGIDAATSWSKEIVEAINDCTVFIVLLSSSSIESKNVVKELSLASEKDKKILPLDLEPVPLTTDFEYQLAGIQRCPMTNIDAIIRALGKLGLTATSAPKLQLVHETDARKSLMILPFEDLSPTGDNGWFADGIVSELISALSNVKALRITDAQTTNEFKRYRGTLPVYAKTMNIRYFVSGDVRKFGDQIKISARLLDIQQGDHLWQDSLRGTMDDIFDIQEQVAKKVVDGLQVILTTEEEKLITERGTANAEAYELFLKAKEYDFLSTQHSLELALSLYSSAIALDPTFAEAYACKAGVLGRLYGSYNRDTSLLDEAFRLVEEARRLKDHAIDVYDTLALLYAEQGRYAEAEAIAKEMITLFPNEIKGYGRLGLVYAIAERFADAITPLEAGIALNASSRTASFILCGCLEHGGDKAKLEAAATRAIPIFEKRLTLFPEDEYARMQLAYVQYCAGQDEAALVMLSKLELSNDGVVLYNAACLAGRLRQPERGLRLFKRALEAGFCGSFEISTFLDHQYGAAALHGTPEWLEAKVMVDTILAESASESDTTTTESDTTESDTTEQQSA